MGNTGVENIPGDGPPAPLPVVGAEIGGPITTPPDPPPTGRVPLWRESLGSPVALLPLILLGVVALVLVYASDLHYFGLSFWGSSYYFNPPGDPASGSVYGIGYYALGSLVTAGLALLLATALSLALAISLVVYLPPFVGRPLTVLTDLLAGIPSIVFGLWGFVIVAPFFGVTLEPSLAHVLGFLPGFGGTSYTIGRGDGTLLAIFILTIMVVPITTAIMREALRSVPRSAVEAGLALGATRWEVVWRVRLRLAKQGLWGAVFLGFGRAFGESVAVAMVIGEATWSPSWLPPNLYAGSYTIASYVFNQWDSAFTYPTLLQSLIEFALVLFLISLLVNVVGHRLTRVGPSPRVEG